MSVLKAMILEAHIYVVSNICFDMSVWRIIYHLPLNLPVYYTVHKTDETQLKPDRHTHTPFALLLLSLTYLVWPAGFVGYIAYCILKP